QATAKSVAGVESERAVRYGSMMASAVPATGTLRVAASSATAAQRARGFRKQAPARLQAAQSSRKTPMTCQAKIARSVGQRSRRAEPPTRFGNSDRRAWERKNSPPKG